MAKYIEELVSQQVRKSELARSKSTVNGQPCGGWHDLPPNGAGRVIADKLTHDLGWACGQGTESPCRGCDVSRRVVRHSMRDYRDQLVARRLGDQEMGGFLYARHLARALTAISKLGCALSWAGRELSDALHVRIDTDDVGSGI